jgi:hypothetical protein
VERTELEADHSIRCRDHGWLLTQLSKETVLSPCVSEQVARAGGTCPQYQIIDAPPHGKGSRLTR